MEGLEAPSVHESAKPENFHQPLESFAYETCLTVVRGFQGKPRSLINSGSCKLEITKHNALKGKVEKKIAVKTNT